MKRFLLRTLAQTASILTAVALAFGVLVLFIAVLGTLAATGGTLRVADGSVLVVDLDGPLSESGQRGSLAEMLSGAVGYPLAAHDAAEALARAARDRRIAAVLLTGGISGSPATLGALREALGEVRAAGKPVLAYYPDLDERGLWWASAAEEVWLEPLGLVELNGWALDVPYLGDLFERYGIGAQVVRVGAYKSAGESFERGRMSEQEREQLGEVLVGRSEHLLGEIARARGIERAALDTWIAEKGLLDARAAVELGLVDRVEPRSGLIAHLRERLGRAADAELDELDLVAYAGARLPRALRPRAARGAGVLVVPAEGEIVDGSSDTAMGGDDLARRLRAAREDDDVAAVVLRVNSPGGSAAASEVIRREVQALRAAGKPVVASMAGVAASGGYWISANADRILAQPETITGSIGVIALLLDVEELAERHGLRAERVATGPLAGTWSPWKRRDPAQVAMVQGLVDLVYEDFLDLVAEGRGMQRDAVDAVAQGRIWTGARALEHGLVDELGGLAEAIERARALAELDADAPVRYDRHEREWFEELLMHKGRDGDPYLARARTALAPTAPPGERTARQLLAPLAWLERFETQGRVLARLPFDIEIR